MDKIKNSRLVLFVLIDAILINLAYLFAIYYKFDNLFLSTEIEKYKGQAIEITLIYLFVFCFFKLYDSLWRYASIDELILSIGGCTTANLLVLGYLHFFDKPIYLSINLLAGIFAIIFTFALRISYRIFRRILMKINLLNCKDYKRVMVVGAGDAGNMIIHEMKSYPEMKFNPVAIIDDNKSLEGSSISGVKVFGDREKIMEIAKLKEIDEIIIAIPSMKSSERKKVIEICEKTSCKIKIIPGIYELIEGRVSLKHMREVNLEDLLGREAVVLDNRDISFYIEDRTILVTGGGGSIGSEICRQVIKFKPHMILIFDVYENNAYELQNELKHKYPALNIKVIIGSVRDKNRLEEVFNEYRPQVVFHLAAHKHVPLMEDNPCEAVKNNIFGTLNTAECADKFGVKRFVMISTDKAVNPTSIMGASKRVSEMIIQAMDKVSKTEFVAVRFGNVLGSSGSVIPLFRNQIAYGGPVTVTHKDITRFFMTIPEAAQLVLQAGAYARGGEIFVLDMGKPVRIYDLACDLIKLSGFEPNKDIKIKFTGLRPGEKLYEELFMAEEGLLKTRHEKIFVEKPVMTDINELRERIDEMKAAIDSRNRDEVIRLIENVTGTYTKEKKTWTTAIKTTSGAVADGNFDEGEDYSVINI